MVEKYKINQGVMVGGSQLLVEDNLQWKTTFGENDLWWKTTFGGTQPLVDDNLWWKRTLGGRGPWVEEDHR